MKYILVLILSALAVHMSGAPPVSKNKKDDDSDKENEIEEKEELADVMEYHRYLNEVVQALESDPEFRAKLEKADEAHIRTGEIADQLEFVNHKVRSRLDELKRQELERLRHLAAKQNQLNNGLDYNHLKIAEHLDHTNSRTFEVNDLKKLIAKTTQDLAEADRRRREKFKQYEMQKKYAEEQSMKGMTMEEKKKYQEELHTLKKERKHQPLHHPGSKQQLEEVWEKQDHMEGQDFNPRTFFHLHDVDGNGLWDQNEVKVLFLKELDKLYAEGAPDNDVYERAEEMERMREHVFNEADVNRDGFIDYKEFLEQTKKPDFQQDQGWEGLDEQQIYSQQEYEAYEKMMQEELQRRIAKGIPPEVQDHVPLHQQQFPLEQGNAPYEHHVPPAVAAHPNQVPVQQQYHGQPQQQLHGQVPQQQPNHGQLPPQHLQGQIPQQQYQGQVLQQQQFQNQVPQQGQHQQQQQQPQQQQQFQQPNLQQQNSQNQVPPQANSPVNGHTQQNVQSQPNAQAVPVQPQAQQSNVPQGAQH